MDKLGIFKLLNSFFDFYKQKSGENSSSPSSPNGEKNGASCDTGAPNSSCGENSQQKPDGNLSFFSPFFSLFGGRGNPSQSPFDSQGGAPSENPFSPFNPSANFSRQKGNDFSPLQNGNVKNTSATISVTGKPLQEKMLSTISRHDDIVKRVSKNNGKH